MTSLSSSKDFHFLLSSQNYIRKHEKRINPIYSQLLPVERNVKYFLLTPLHSSVLPDLRRLFKLVLQETWNTAKTRVWWRLSIGSVWKMQNYTLWLAFCWKYLEPVGNNISLLCSHWLHIHAPDPRLCFLRKYSTKTKERRWLGWAVITSDRNIDKERVGIYLEPFIQLYTNTIRRAKAVSANWH